MSERTKSFPWKAATFIIAFILICIPIVQFIWFAFSPYKSISVEPIAVEIHKGETPNDITRILLTHNLIGDGKLFIWVGRITRQWKRIKAGEYSISPQMTPIEIFSTLTSGISIAHPVTVKEGENMYEIADDLNQKGLANREHFISLCKDSHFIESLGLFKEHIPATLEGYFFPDTYFFNKSLTDSDMIRQMVKKFFSLWGELEAKRAKELDMTQHQILTLASIIEKETGAPEERTLISSVFHNRLHKRMRLQSDPTTIYGMWSTYKGKIHKSDLSTKNEYNTYTIDALPIGPIGNPGKEAIHAALYPADTPYLYFVSHNDGTHQFSQTLEEHNHAVRKFQLDPLARIGKSWRDHLKKPVSIQPASVR